MIAGIPFEVTDDVLISTTAADESHALWIATTSYTSGTRVRRPNHHIYENAVPGVSSIAPEDSCIGTGAKWMDCGMVNSRLMFDAKSRTQTEFTGSGTVVLQYNGIPTLLSLINLVGTSVSVSMVADGATVFEAVVSLDGTSITTFWQYMTAPFVQKRNVVFVLPPYYQPTITITIIGTGTVKCGVCQAGYSQEIGRAQKQSGLSVKNFGTLNFSTTTGDVTDYVPRWNKKTENLIVLILNSEIEGFLGAIDSLLSVYCMWVPSVVDKFQFLAMYGVCSSYDLVLKGSTYSTYNISIREL